MKKFFQSLYNFFLRNRRLRRMTAILEPCMPRDGHILDLGCGNGDLASALKERVPHLSFTGLEVSPQISRSAIPIFAYDGSSIPYGDDSFDYVMLITVMHHTDDYVPLMKEARRVAREGIILLDHQYAGKLEWMTLAFIDWPGNVPFGVYTPFNFKTRPEWQALFKQLRLEETYYNDSLYMFGKLFDLALGKKMHFISLLKKVG